MVFCLPRRWPARRRKMKKSIGFYGVICLCALCARMAQTKGRERTTKKKLTQKRKQKRTPRTPPKSHNTHNFGRQKWLPKSIPGPIVSLLAPGFAQGRPQDASKSALGSLRGGRNKALDAPKGAPGAQSQCPGAPWSAPIQPKSMPSRVGER